MRLLFTAYQAINYCTSLINESICRVRDITFVVITAPSFLRMQDAFMHAYYTQQMFYSILINIFSYPNFS